MSRQDLAVIETTDLGNEETNMLLQRLIRHYDSHAHGRIARQPHHIARLEGILQDVLAIQFSYVDLIALRERVRKLFFEMHG